MKLVNMKIMVEVCIILVVGFFVTTTLCTISTASLEGRCPYHCVCTATNLNCNQGFQVDTATLRLMSPDLERITFNEFLIRELSSNLFQPFSHLKILAITASRVREISVDAFSMLNDISSLNLSNNHIAELPQTIFRNNINLAAIDLSHNLIETLPELLFSNLAASLKLLRLDNNRMQVLSPRLFDSLTHLEHLDLSNNELTYILPRTFSSLSRVKYIDLNDNLIVTMNEDLIQPNNSTVELSILRNPLVCNCGLIWLRKVVLGNVSHVTVRNTSSVTCSSPHAFHGQRLNQVALEELNCTLPTAYVSQSQGLHYYGNQIHLSCHVGGDPYPSVVWQTPMGDLISDPYSGQWLDSTINHTTPETMYKIYATGETINFKIKTSAGYSTLLVSNAHLLSSGEYLCTVINPAGKVVAPSILEMSSAIDTQYTPSLLCAVYSLAIAVVGGVLGCSITACMEKCSCCQTPLLKYYDTAIVSASTPSCSHRLSEEKLNQDEDSPMISDCVDDNIIIDAGDDEEADAAVSGSADADGSVDDDDDLISLEALDDQSYARLASLCELSEKSALTAEEWDAYFREFPDDFLLEGFSSTPSKLESSSCSSKDSPTHKLPHGKTLDTLEAVRLRLKLRVERIEVMRERLRNHMGKRSAKMKDNMARQKIRMNKKMQTIKESTTHSLQSIKESTSHSIQTIKDSTSQSLQTIRETGRNYSHKLHQGVRMAMENVDGKTSPEKPRYHVLSLREFCGTGDLGQTISIATITTDIDTNEVTQLRRSVTMV